MNSTLFSEFDDFYLDYLVVGMKKFTARDGSVFIFREPRMSDAKKCLEYVNGLVDEGAKIIIDKKVTMKDERAWLKETIGKMRKGQLILVMAEKDGDIVSICHLAKRGYKMSHVADLGIGVSKKYRRIGLAQAIFQETLRKARGRGIEIIKLGTYEDNAPARSLYRKLGFKREAVLKDEIKCKCDYTNVIAMSLDLRKGKRL